MAGMKLPDYRNGIIADKDTNLFDAVSRRYQRIQAGEGYEDRAREKETDLAPSVSLPAIKGREELNPFQGDESEIEQDIINHKGKTNYQKAMELKMIGSDKWKHFAGLPEE